ncbi:hypothetical protein ACHAXN_005501 [Cyclotella atomus]
MSANVRGRCLDEFKSSSFSAIDNDLTNVVEDSEEGVKPLPSAVMSTPEYIRIHANAPPSTLRHIIKTQIFPSDDVNYLKRLVGDIGNLEYVFRFLWFDGPKPTSYSDEWDDTNVKYPQCGSGAAAWNESPTRGETNWGSSTYSSARRRAATDASRSTIEAQQPSVRSSKKGANRSGRTWIQYCCYYNAHQCLQWIFREVVRKHLDNLNREHENQASAISERGLHGSLARQTNSRKLSVEPMHIIYQLLEYPSHCYCATNYVAVAAIRNSHDCLLMLLQYGGLDPNMQINSHGSTASHIAAWKDNVECLQVLKSGCYSSGFTGDDGEESFDSGDVISQSSSKDDESNNCNKEEHPHRDAFSSIAAVPLGPHKTWAADWNRINEQGETSLHVAAREGSCRAMQFFLDLAFSFAEAESYSNDEGHRARLHCLSEDGVKESKQLNLHSESEKLRAPLDFSLRNKDGMDCTALAAQNNHPKIIEMIGRCIQQIKEIDDDSSQDIKQSSSEGFWDKPFQSLLGTAPQDRLVPKPPPPQSHLSSLRRRANTDPVRFHIENKVSKTSISEHNINNQLSLPRYHPSLNQRNVQEKSNHETPIHVAARQGNVAVLKALFDSKHCDTPARDALGQTALHIAVLALRIDVIQFFVDLNIEQFKRFDVVDILGRTPLYIACSLGYSSIARILVPVSNWRVLCHEKRQSTDSPLLVNVSRGQPPLHAAVINNHLNTVNVLLQCGVSVDQLDVDGRTAIISAAKLGLYEMCQMLILHGANVNARSSKGGPTPYQKAKKYKHTNVADLLYEFGGR